MHMLKSTAQNCLSRNDAVFQSSQDVDIAERSQLCAEIDRLTQELWGRKCCIDRQDAELRGCRQRIKELEDRNFLQQELILSETKLKSFEHARHAAKPNIVEQSNMIEAIAQMQSALESLTAAAQSQTQMDASELAFQKNVHKLSALQSAQNVQNFERCSSNSMEYTKQGNHSFRSCRSTADTESAEADVSSHSNSMRGDKPSDGLHFEMAGVPVDLLSSLNKQAVASLQGDQYQGSKQEQLIGVE